MVHVNTHVIYVTIERRTLFYLKITVLAQTV